MDHDDRGRNRQDMFRIMDQFGRNERDQHPMSRDYRPEWQGPSSRDFDSGRGTRMDIDSASRWMPGSSSNLQNFNSNPQAPVENIRQTQTRHENDSRHSRWDIRAPENTAPKFPPLSSISGSNYPPSNANNPPTISLYNFSTNRQSNEIPSFQDRSRDNKWAPEEFSGNQSYPSNPQFKSLSDLPGSGGSTSFDNRSTSDLAAENERLRRELEALKNAPSVSLSDENERLRKDIEALKAQKLREKAEAEEAQKLRDELAALKSEDNRFKRSQAEPSQGWRQSFDERPHAPPPADSLRWPESSHRIETATTPEPESESDRLRRELKDLQNQIEKTKTNDFDARNQGPELVDIKKDPAWLNNIRASIRTTKEEQQTPCVPRYPDYIAPATVPPSQPVPQFTAAPPPVAAQPTFTSNLIQYPAEFIGMGRSQIDKPEELDPMEKEKQELRRRLELVQKELSVISSGKNKSGKEDQKEPALAEKQAEVKKRVDEIKGKLSEDKKKDSGSKTDSKSKRTSSPNKSSTRKRSRSPGRKRSKSPSRKRSRSPRRKRSRSPSRKDKKRSPKRDEKYSRRSRSRERSSKDKRDDRKKKEGKEKKDSKRSESPEIIAVVSRSAADQGSKSVSDVMRSFGQGFEQPKVTQPVNLGWSTHTAAPASIPPPVQMSWNTSLLPPNVPTQPTIPLTTDGRRFSQHLGRSFTSRCSMCYYRHYTDDCAMYPTVQARQKRLRELGLCWVCVTAHAGPHNFRTMSWKPCRHCGAKDHSGLLCLSPMHQEKLNGILNEHQRMGYHQPPQDERDLVAAIEAGLIRPSEISYDQEKESRWS